MSDAHGFLEYVGKATYRSTQHLWTRSVRWPWGSIGKVSMDARASLKQESVGLVVICLTERVTVKWNL